MPEMLLAKNRAQNLAITADLINARDWTTSPLGHPSTWPGSLQAVVNLILHSRFPMFVAWGPELGLIYNEPYTAFLGAKHPVAFGSRFQDVWQEIWPDILLLITSALEGEPVYAQDMPLVINWNGREEQKWFTFSYSPLFDDAGSVAGMYCVVNETTDRVLAERRQTFQLKMADSFHGLSEPQQMMEAASGLIGRYFTVGRVGYGEIDATESCVSVYRDWTDGNMASLAGESRPLASFGPRIIDDLRAGKTLQLQDIAADPRSAPYSAGYASIGVHSMIVVPLLDGQRLRAILYLHESTPRRWTDEETTLVEDVARRTWDAVKRARTEATLRDETRTLEILNETAKMMSSTLDLPTLMQSITDAATRLTDAKFGAFFYTQRTGEGEALLLYTLAGAPREAFETLGHPRPTAIFSPTFSGGPPIRIDDVLTDERYGRSGPYYGMPKGHLPVRSYLAVSVVSHSGDPIGGLFFGHPDAGIFTERTERLIVGLAGQAAVAIDNARLYAAAQSTAAERESLLARERAARAEAERLNAMKDEFLAMLAHELRNPLAPISSAAELLNMLYAAEPRVRKTSAIISRQVAHMTRLVDDLLDVSRVTRGLITLSKQRIDFQEVVSGALDQARPGIDVKRHLVIVEMPERPLFLEGDHTRLVQVVANILSNAGKYTPEGGTITLTASVSQETLTLDVQDNGSGIAPELLPHVFELFTQGARTLARSQGGLGLGLALVRKLVDLHGGQVSAHSDGIGKGSRFTIRLPIASTGFDAVTSDEGLSNTSDSSEPKAEGEPRQSLHLMIIDDNIDAADTLATLLNAEGYIVSVEYTAQGALDRVRSEGCPDVFLVDIGLPDLDGYELARRLKTSAQTASALLVAITGYSQKPDQEKAQRAGFSHHFVKPVSTTALLKTLRSTLPINGGSMRGA